jgi:FkbM family methyltransferase
VDDLLLKLSNGTRLYSPATLNSITTYVLLEQETWFEKEFDFVEHLLRPGMHAIDIGANLGTYSLAMAKAVGPTGRVTAYEPTSATRARLERSCRENGASQIEVLPYALSDGARTGRIVFENSSELNHLGGDGEGEGESVEITSLDIDAARFGWSDTYFIKVDAEGEEIPILKGAAALLRDHSPLLMLELHASSVMNVDLIKAVEALGYRTYRLLGREPILVPLEVDDVDNMELNFFAAKDDRAEELEGRGLLVRSTEGGPVSDADVRQALAHLRSQPFAAAFATQFADGAAVAPGYAEALGGFHVSRDAGRLPRDRVAALRAGYGARCHGPGTAACRDEPAACGDH